MKSYQVSLTKSRADLLTLEDVSQKDVRYIGAYPAERAALHILVSVTYDLQLANAMAERFQAHFFSPARRHSFVVTEHEIMEWLSKQVSAST